MTLLLLFSAEHFTPTHRMGARNHEFTLVIIQIRKHILNELAAYDDIMVLFRSKNETTVFSAPHTEVVDNDSVSIEYYLVCHHGFLLNWWTTLLF